MALWRAPRAAVLNGKGRSPGQGQGESPNAPPHKAVDSLCKPGRPGPDPKATSKGKKKDDLKQQLPQSVGDDGRAHSWPRRGTSSI